MNKQVILAMSGGVDSSVAAHLLKEKGYSVIGITFKLWPKGFCGMHGAKSCCSVESIDDARSVCAKLDIPHYVINCAKLFKKEVIDYFLKTYEKGQTPNPCIVCNEKIKFPLLLKKAKEIGADYIATGHYARCLFDKKSSRFLVKEGKDKNKDQSYVLFSLTQRALMRLLLPVGDFKKEKIRSIAKKLGLRVYDKKDSQEICFILDNNLERFLKEKLGKRIKPGLITDKRGKILGTHPGTCFFTIGQRKGLRIPYGKPLYVTDIRYRAGHIIAGEYRDTLKKNFIVKDLSWMAGTELSKPIEAQVKIRYQHPKSKAFITPLTRNSCVVDFLKPQSAPTPGQAAVFYKKDTVLGGGWIKS
ncbi:MAG: tRNA 2-thiouridine(34) synthase MnmA [Candidatus Omnitrophica bacterium]|nr:tRNA 2-thiouridine(34) synthase MnmA [Candidatus Omnitrophota bacterium]